MFARIPRAFPIWCEGTASVKSLRMKAPKIIEATGSSITIHANKTEPASMKGRKKQKYVFTK